MHQTPAILSNLRGFPSWPFATDMRGGTLSGSPLRADGGPTLAEIRDRLAGAMTLAEIAEVGGLLFQELSTPDPPPLSTGANGAMVATATPAPAFADASSVVPAGVGRSPWGDSSQCGLPGTSVPLNGAAMCTPRSLCNDVGGCQASPSKEGPPQCAPSTAALTDDGGLLGSPPAKNTCQGIVPAALFTPDLPPSTCDKLVTTIPIALHRETTPVMNNAAASVSTSTGGLLSLTEPTMEIQNREDPKRRDQPPCSIPPTGRGHPGVCVEPLRPDDGGCDMSLDMRTIHVSRWTPWLSDLRPPPMLPQRLRARPHPFSSRNSTHWRRQLPRDL